MFTVLSVQGCLPHINLEVDKNGETLVFGTFDEANNWAKWNCAWEYKIVEW